jgi:hypothetical protein
MQTMVLAEERGAEHYFNHFSWPFSFMNSIFPFPVSTAQFKGKFWNDW